MSNTQLTLSATIASELIENFAWRRHNCQMPSFNDYMQTLEFEGTVDN